MWKSCSKIVPVIQHGYLAWLQSSTTKPQWFQFFKLGFLKIPNVTIWSIFQNQATHAYTHTRTYMCVRACVCVLQQTATCTLCNTCFQMRLGCLQCSFSDDSDCFCLKTKASMQLGQFLCRMWHFPRVHDKSFVHVILYPNIIIIVGQQTMHICSYDTT